MHLTKKFDRAFQWAGEKMGGEARTTQTDDFRALEVEMSSKQQGLDRLSKSMTSYVRWASRRCDALEDRERASPMAYFGRTMAAYGEEQEAGSELGNSLAAVGHANERIAGLQDTLIEQANTSWSENLERNLAMMKEYNASRKKLENRRLAYDASTAKMDKARRDDYRIEEEVRTNKVKFEETSEDVFRRMLDIKEAEADSVTALNEFLEAQLDFHERCAEELRRARHSLISGVSPVGGASHHHQYGTASPPRQHTTSSTRTPPTRSRSNTARSWQEPRNGSVYEEPEPMPERVSAAPLALPSRLRNVSPSHRAAPPQPPRPPMSRAVTSDGRPMHRSAVNPPPLPLTRVRTDGTAYGSRTDDVFADDASTASGGSGSPDIGDRSLSPATSYGSLNRSTGQLAGAGKKPPPPPPVNRAKKPAPPVPSRRADLGY